MDITITLTEVESKAMEYVAVSAEDWATNALKNRARVAIDEITQLTVQKCLEQEIQIPSTKEDIVQLAFDMGWVLTADQRNSMPVQE